jgi:serine/threonine-protein kinase
MGAVYLARQSRPWRLVAVKILATPSLNTDIYLERFRREADTVAALEHPNIMPVYAYGEQYGLAYLVMPYIKGGSLYDCLTREGRFPLDKVVNYLDQIAAAVEVAHKHGVIHRDIKPANILITPEERLLLADFGLVKVIDGDQSLQSPLTDPLMTPGTPAYMAPEQAFGEEIDPRADLYSLGVVLYQMVTGTLPFQGSPLQIISQLHFPPPPPRTWRPDLPVTAERVILRAIAKRPEQRYACAKHLADAFRMAVNPACIYVSSVSPADISPTRPDSPEMQKSPVVHQNFKDVSSRRLFLREAGTLLATTLVAGAIVYAVYPLTHGQKQSGTATTDYDVAVTQNGIMFGFDAAHTHCNPYEQVINTSNIDRLVLNWQYHLGGIMESSPVVAHGMVYAGSDDGYFRAIDARTGRQIWTAPAEGSISSSPAMAKDLVYVGSHDHKLYAFDASTGQQKWASSTQDQIKSSPAVVNGMVYVGSYDHKLYAFDASTGQQKWAFATGDAIFASPAVANGIVYIGSKDGRLYALDASTGQQKWASSTGGPITSSPAVFYHVVYVGSQDDKLYAFGASTGQRKWAAPTGSKIDSSPAIDNGTIYVGSRDHKLYAFDATTGQQKWTFSTKNGVFASPTIANGIVYVGSWDHRLYALDASTGQQKWVFVTGNSIASSPVVADGIVYVGSKDGKLYAFHLA